jgi:hypothetical protein
VIGFSHGGWAVLKAVLAGLVRRPDEPAFAAAVAYYPGCDPPAAALETDTFILIGDADDWTPAARCARWRDAVQTNGHVLQMKTYPGARRPARVRRAFSAPFLCRPLYRAGPGSDGRFPGRDPRIFQRATRPRALAPTGLRPTPFGPAHPVAGVRPPKARVCGGCRNLSNPDIALGSTLAALVSGIEHPAGSDQQ